MVSRLIAAVVVILQSPTLGIDTKPMLSQVFPTGSIHSDMASLRAERNQHQEYFANLRAQRKHADAEADHAQTRAEKVNSKNKRSNSKATTSEKKTSQETRSFTIDTAQHAQQEKASEEEKVVEEFTESFGLLSIGVVLLVVAGVAYGLGVYSAFVVYFADNILVMLMACSASMLGAAFFTSWTSDAVEKNILGLLANVFITVGLWAIARKVISDNEKSESTVEKTATMWTHIIDMIPWIIKVGALNLLCAVHSWMVRGTNHPADMGERFTISFFAFVALVLMTHCVNMIWAKMSSGDADKYSLGLFLLDAANGSLLSCSGKALHFALVVVVFALHDDGDKDKTLVAYCVFQVIMTMVCGFFLVYCLPRFLTTTRSDEVSHDLLSFLVIYCWAFSFVDFSWWYFYNYLGDSSVAGQIYFWWFVLGLLVIALVLAKLCKGSFYGGPSDWSKALGNMLCWTIDFSAWWGWGTAMAGIDASINAKPAHYQVTLVNVGVTVGFVFLTGAAYYLADIGELIKSHIGRTSPVAHKKGVAALS